MLSRILKTIAIFGRACPWLAAAVACAQGPVNVSVSPSSGIGISQVFAFTSASPAAGFANIAGMNILFNSGVSAAGGCYLYYSPDSKTATLSVDAGNAWGWSGTLGVAGAIENSQCRLDLGSSSVAGSGTALTVKLALTFKSGMPGSQRVFLWTIDRAGQIANWQQMGTWTTTPVSSQAPAAVSVTPSAGAGVSQTFQYLASSTNGYAYITNLLASISSTVGSSDACSVFYDRAANYVYMLDDQGRWTLSSYVGIPGQLQNSRCSLDTGVTYASGSGNTLALNLKLTFTASWLGTKTNTLTVTDRGSQTVSAQLGSWVVQDSVAPPSKQQTLYLRYGAAPKVVVTAASTGTPIQITTKTPHTFQPGQVVWCWGIQGPTKANGTRRVQSVIDQTHFTLSYMDGTPATGLGATSFSAATRIGAFCGATLPYSLEAQPRLWLDGPGGTLTRALQDPDGAGPQLAPRAVASNVPWNSMTSWLDNNSIQQNYQWNGPQFPLFRGGSFSAILAMALRWFSDNSQATALAGAKHWLTNAERITETLACDETLPACGNSTDSDYGAGYFTIPIAQTYSLVRSQLTTQETRRILDMLLNDNTDSNTCTNMYTPGSGVVVSATSNPQVMIGSGTNWKSTLSPGDTILLPTLREPRVVVSVDSDTQIHYRSTNLAGIAFSGQYTYEIAHPWQPGNCGWSFWAKHSGASTLSIYPDYKTLGGLGLQDLHSNQFLTKEAVFLAVGLATADDDDRGARMAEGAANWFEDIGFPLYHKFWTGPAQIDSQYGPDRFGEFMDEIVQNLRNATGGVIDYTRGNWLKNRAMFDIYEWLPTSGPYTWSEGLVWGTSALSLRNVTKGLDGGQLPALIAGSDEAQYLTYFAKNVRGDYTKSGLNIGSCYACPFYYAFSDPSSNGIDYRTLINTSKAFIHTDVEATSPTTNTSMIIDRTGFSSPSDTILHIMAVDVERDTNHLSSATTGSSNPASYSVYKNGYLLAEDLGRGVMRSAGGYVNWDQKSMYMEIGGIEDLKDSNGTTVFADVEVPRYADGGSGPNMNKYMYALVDASGAYNATAAITRLNRHFIDFKGGTQQAIVVYDDVQTSSGKLKRTYLHYPNNGQSGEGTTTFSQANSSITSIGGPSGGALLTKVLFPGVPGFTYVDSPDGTYPGGVGQTFRVSICAGAGASASGCDANNTQGEFVVVHLPMMAQGNLTAAANLMAAVDPGFIGVEVAGVSPKIAVLSRGGLLQDHVSFSSSQPLNSQIMVAGLAAGVYDVTRDGSRIATITVSDHDNTLYFESTGGAFVISTVGAGPFSGHSNFLTPSVVGRTYASKLSAFGGRPPYRWRVTAGVVPEGIQVDSDGSVRGISNRAGEFSWTMEVTDQGGNAAQEGVVMTIGDRSDELAVEAADVSASRATIMYGRDGMLSETECVVMLGSDPEFQDVLWQFQDNGGSAFRQHAIGPEVSLAPGTRYFVRAICGSANGDTNFMTGGSRIQGTRRGVESPAPGVGER